MWHNVILPLWLAALAIPAGSTVPPSGKPVLPIEVLGPRNHRNANHRPFGGEECISGISLAAGARSEVSRAGERSSQWRRMDTAEERNGNRRQTGSHFRRHRRGIFHVGSNRSPR